MASPQHCASCIGRHSFPYYHAPHRGGALSQSAIRPSVCPVPEARRLLSTGRTDRRTPGRYINSALLERAASVYTCNTCCISLC